MKQQLQVHSVKFKQWLSAFGATLLLFCSVNATAATVSFNPSAATVGLGQIFTVDILGSDFTTALAGGEIDLGFDSTRLQVNSVSINPYFDFLPVSGGPAVGNTWLNIGFDTFANAPASGPITIATINFTALALGSANLSILGSSTFFGETAAITPSLISGTVTVVPVPAAAWLFGSGLLGFAAMVRRKSA